MIKINKDFIDKMRRRSIPKNEIFREYKVVECNVLSYDVFKKKLEKYKELGWRTDGNPVICGMDIQQVIIRDKVIENWMG